MLIDFYSLNSSKYHYYRPTRTPTNRDPKLKRTLSSSHLLARLQITLNGTLMTVRVGRTIMCIITSRMSTHLIYRTHRNIRQHHIRSTAHKVIKQTSSSNFNHQHRTNTGHFLIGLRLHELHVRGSHFNIVNRSSTLMRTGNQHKSSSLITKIRRDRRYYQRNLNHTIN